MAKIISRPQDGCVLIPLHLCAGVNFSGIHFKQVTYKYEVYIIAEYGLELCQRLALKGIEVGSPILHDYDWPSKYPTPFDHQKDTADFMVRNLRSYCFNAIGCVSADTEYLTPTGWERMDAYSGGRVGQFIPETGAVEFVDAEYVVKPCSQMYHFKTNFGVDQMLSGDHRVLYRGSTGKLAERPAHEVAARHNKSSHGFSGGFITTFTPPTGSELDLSDEVLRVQVALIADGTFPNKSLGKPNRSSTCILNIKRQRKKDRIVKLLNEAAIPYTRRDLDSGYSRFQFKAPRKEKEFTSWYWGASQQQLGVIADECVYWDGTFRKGAAREFCSTSKQSADFIQYAFSATGHTATVNVQHHADRSDMYSVHARACSKDVTMRSTDKQQIPLVPTSDGKMYCFMVPSTFLLLRRNGRIFATGNTSKTLTALWAADYLMREKRIKKVLITSTLSTLWSVWEHEIFVNLMPRTSTVLHGTVDRRLKRLAEDVDYYIINHDGLKLLQSELIAEKFDLIIVDEGAEFKNSSTDLWKAANSICGEKSGCCLWWMTGAPMPKEPTDAWAQARIVNPDNVPKYFSRFRELTMVKINQFKWVPKQGWRDIVYACLKPAIRYTREQCLDLPPVMYVDHTVPMSKEQETAYESLRKHLVVQLESGLVTALNEAALRSKILQVACGAIYDSNGESHFLDVSPKLNELKAAIAESGNKIIIFVPFKHTIKLIKKWLDEKQSHLTYGVVNGDVGTTKRNKIFDGFQHDSLNIILAHPAAMAHGLTLTAGFTILWWGPVDDYKIYDQANGRITRPGQTSKQYIKHLICSKAERVIYQRLKTKESMQDSLLDMIQK